MSLLVLRRDKRNRIIKYFDLDKLNTVTLISLTIFGIVAIVLDIYL